MWIFLFIFFLSACENEYDEYCETYCDWWDSCIGVPSVTECVEDCDKYYTKNYKCRSDFESFVVCIEEDSQCTLLCDFYFNVWTNCNEREYE